MPFVDISTLAVTERLPAWRGRYFHAANMTLHKEVANTCLCNPVIHPSAESLPTSRQSVQNWDSLRATSQIPFVRTLRADCL